ncbi:DUF6221 family protein [Microbispora rosea]|uniref:DUF6221 family protein n=1 Tax=Microbispora rosea TaxID=58117 RepID=UPI003798FD70
MVSDLIAFLRARWDTEARDAQELLDDNQESRTSTGYGSTLWDEQDLEARWTLRDVEAKRKILAALESARKDLDGVGEAGLDAVMYVGKVSALRDVVSALAEPYADHEDYREEWRP